jgi:hypothetical protein
MRTGPWLIQTTVDVIARVDEKDPPKARGQGGLNWSQLRDGERDGVVKPQAS